MNNLSEQLEKIGYEDARLLDVQIKQFGTQIIFIFMNEVTNSTVYEVVFVNIDSVKYRTYAEMGYYDSDIDTWELANLSHYGQSFVFSESLTAGFTHLEFDVEPFIGELNFQKMRIQEKK